MAEAQTAPSGAFENGEHLYPIRVYYDDTDAAGMVYYANYLKMSERARTEMMRVLGIEHTEMARSYGIAILVRRCEIDYLRPARLDDALRVHTRIFDVGGASFRVEQIIRRAGEDLARLILRLACVTTDGRVARFPAWLRESLDRFVNPPATANRA